MLALVISMYISVSACSWTFLSSVWYSISSFTLPWIVELCCVIYAHLTCNIFFQTFLLWFFYIIKVFVDFYRIEYTETTIF